MTGKTETWGCVGDMKNYGCSEADRAKIYVQPKRREMYRPPTKYCPQNASVETNSIYRHVTIQYLHYIGLYFDFYMKVVSGTNRGVGLKCRNS